MKNVKIEWCENFIKSVFRKHVPENGAIEINCFWNIAERSGLLHTYTARKNIR